MTRYARPAATLAARAHVGARAQPFGAAGRMASVGLAGLVGQHRLGVTPGLLVDDGRPGRGAHDHTAVRRVPGDAGRHRVWRSCCEVQGLPVTVRHPARVHVAHDAAQRRARGHRFARGEDLGGLVGDHGHAVFGVAVGADPAVVPTGGGLLDAGRAQPLGLVLGLVGGHRTQLAGVIRPEGVDRSHMPAVTV